MNVHTAIHLLIYLNIYIFLLIDLVSLKFSFVNFLSLYLSIYSPDFVIHSILLFLSLHPVIYLSIYLTIYPPFYESSHLFIYIWSFGKNAFAVGVKFLKNCFEEKRDTFIHMRSLGKSFNEFHILYNFRMIQTAPARLDFSLGSKFFTMSLMAYSSISEHCLAKCKWLI